MLELPLYINGARRLAFDVSPPGDEAPVFLVSQRPDGDWDVHANTDDRWESGVPITTVDSYHLPEFIEGLWKQSGYEVE